MGGRRQTGDSSSIIEQLITETLLQFTSLRDKQASTSGQSDSPVSSQSQPFTLASFEDFSKWTDDQVASDQRKAAQLVRNTLPAHVFEEGNLAALEGPDEPLSARAADNEQSIEVVDDSGKELIARMPSSRPPPSSRSAGATPSRPPSKSSFAVTALLLVVITAATAVAVWYSGLV
jgi:hypothetical protein